MADAGEHDDRDHDGDHDRDHDDNQRTRVAASEALYERALRADLERRITALAQTPDAAFGRMGVADGIVVGLLFVAAPALVAWIFR